MNPGGDDCILGKVSLPTIEFFNGYVSFREGTISIGNSTELFIFQTPMYHKLSMWVSERIGGVQFHRLENPWKFP